jgi:drug/metabolite transporter (DMT)-like permease
MLAAAILFGEHLGPSVWVGAMLITLGVAMVGTTERAPGPPIAP